MTQRGVHILRETYAVPAEKISLIPHGIPDLPFVDPNFYKDQFDIAGRPVISRGFVYAVGHSGVMQAMDIRTGQPRWSVPIAGVNAPLPVGDVVYVVSKNGELTVVNRDTGAVYWTRNLNEGRVRQEGGVLGFWDRTVRPEWSGPILASNRLVLVNSEGEAVAFDPKTGALMATLRLGGAAYLAPIAYNGALYVLTDNGDLVSIR
jgi:outer membrane protein assembly factor BamB